MAGWRTRAAPRGALVAGWPARSAFIRDFMDGNFANYICYFSTQAFKLHPTGTSRIMYPKHDPKTEFDKLFTYTCVFTNRIDVGCTMHAVTPPYEDTFSMLLPQYNFETNSTIIDHLALNKKIPKYNPKTEFARSTARADSDCTKYATSDVTASAPALHLARHGRRALFRL